MAIQGSTQELLRSIVGSSDRSGVLVERARQCILDFTAVAVAGQSDALVNGTDAVSSVEYASGSAVDLTSGQRLSPEIAVMSNSYNAHLHDFDDYHLEVPGHAGVTVIPAALAAAEVSNATLGQLCDSIAAGVAAVTQLGRTVGETLFQLGWHPTAMFGGVGAAVATALVFGADETQTSNAISLALCRSSGLMQAFGTEGKAWQVAGNTRDGYLAAKFATGHKLSLMPDLLGGPRGALALWSHGEVAELAPVTCDSPKSLIQTQFKTFPTCFGTHAAIRASEQIQNQPGFFADGIVSVSCVIDEGFKDAVIRPSPQDLNAARFSVSAAIALTLLGQAPRTPDFFTNSVREDFSYKRIESLVKVDTHSSLGTGEAKVVVTLEDGTVFSVYEPRSEARQPADDWRELIAKFDVLIAGRVSAHQAEWIKKTIQSGPLHTPVREITTALTGATSFLRGQ